MGVLTSGPAPLTTLLPHHAMEDSARHPLEGFADLDIEEYPRTCLL